MLSQKRRRDAHNWSFAGSSLESVIEQRRRDRLFALLTDTTGEPRAPLYERDVL
jgi:hypothetical protein